METFSALLVLCAGKSPVAGEFPAQRPVARSFDVFFDLRLYKRLGKQSWGGWSETLSRSLCRHCNDMRWLHHFRMAGEAHSRVTLYTAGHLHTAVPHCWHSRAPIVHTAVPRENNEHGCVYLRCRAVCKLPGCVEGHPWHCHGSTMTTLIPWPITVFPFTQSCFNKV